MTKFAFMTTTTLLLAVAGVGIAASGSEQNRELRRVDCRDITMFAPAENKSADELCRNYGGLANVGASPSKQGLVILVRNRPMGGFNGQDTVQ